MKSKRRYNFNHGAKRLREAFLIVKRLQGYGVDPCVWVHDAINQGIKISLLK